jgi:hypothetical protein
MKRHIYCFGCILALIVSAGSLYAQPKTLLEPPLRVDRDDKDIPEPEFREISELYDRLRNMWLRHIDLGYTARRMAHRPALNVNAWDEVPDSSWFTNRIGKRPLTREELLRGSPGNPPRDGTLWILRLKTEGYTPGIRIKDEAGERYVLKFDLPNGPERNSAADRIGSLIAHAAGYNAPFNSIVRFRESDLLLDTEAYFEDPMGRRRPLTQTDVEDALSRIARRKDGSYRGMASHFIPGIPKGWFPYWGTRKDDPNDLVPHELRRELRGLRVIASWFNHVDVKEINTHETFVAENDRGYLKHYLIDFGSTMGSGDFINGPCRVGFEHIFDGGAIGHSLITLGAWARPWEELCHIEHPEVGWFEAELFDASKWKANYPNLAFVEMDESDGYWGAKIVTAFTDELVWALAEAGEYSRSEVTRYVEETFLRRRDKIGLYWLDLVTPLEDFELETGGEKWILTFRDLGVERGYAEKEDRVYHYVVKDALEFSVISEGQSRDVGRIQIDPVADIQPAPTDRWGRVPLAVVEISSNRREKGLALPVRVVIGFDDESSATRVLGWKHAPKE